ncbi:MAG: LacI family transcriptional regulator, partial [Aliifodinibius sp.]|nr:LacI family transcriptional regulator [Fodinibius sp.]NIV11280.1 LacI family transcriptional regulator [Fodinibius sp.]NIY24894.1 LacI family transcriptional regulator [Fodinibius sp.]
MTYVELLRRKRLDGYIIMPVGTKYDHLKQMLEDKLSLVLLDRSFDELNANSVVVDNYQGAFEAVEHLILSGHTRIAIIQGTQETFTNTQRVKGYRDALAKYNIDVK